MAMIETVIIYGLLLFFTYAITKTFFYFISALPTRSTNREQSTQSSLKSKSRKRF